MDNEGLLRYLVPELLESVSLGLAARFLRRGSGCLALAGLRWLIGSEGLGTCGGVRRGCNGHIGSIVYFWLSFTLSLVALIAIISMIKLLTYYMNKSIN